MARKLPGFAECLRLMRRRDPWVQEEGFGLLRAQAHAFVPELLQAFEVETDTGLRLWLLELLVEARDPRTMPLFTALLGGDDEMARGWAVEGLRALDTKEARTVLFDAGETR